MPRSEDGRTGAAFAEVAVGLLAERRMTVRGLARAVGASPSHISRVLRAADGKRPSADLIRRVSTALDVDEDCFLEARRARITAQLDRNAALVEDIYERCMSEVPPYDARDAAAATRLGHS